MRRISKRTREKAIEACLCIADLLIVNGGIRPNYGYDRDLDGVPGVAFSAVNVAVSTQPFTGDRAWLVWCYLEAAALLRDGWSPGDPVRLLKES